LISSQEVVFVESFFNVSYLDFARSAQIPSTFSSCVVSSEEMRQRARILEKETSTNTESKKPNNLERTNEARKLNDETLKETVELFREVRKNNPKWLQGSVLSAVAEQITSVNTGAGVKRRLNKAIEHGFIELSELNF
jgi:hypothetical protein